MDNQMQIFTNKEFGQVRTVIKNQEVWFIGKDVASALGYKNTKDALINHVDTEDKTIIKRSEIATIENYLPKTAFSVNFVDGNIPNRGLTIINESGLYSLVLSSKLPTAKEFKRWVTKEILPSIRKNGYYSFNQNRTTDKQDEADLLNARARVAELWLKLGDRTEIKEYKQITDSYASEVLAGKRVLPLPEVSQKTYSAGEIGAMLGVSARKIGRIANLNNLKTEEYGKFFYDKSRYSSKEVETFRYFDNAISKFKELIA